MYISLTIESKCSILIAVVSKLYFKISQGINLRINIGNDTLFSNFGRLKHFLILIIYFFTP